MSHNAAALVRDVIATIEVRETYEEWTERLRRKGAFLASRRVKRASLAELLNPPTEGYGGTRAR